VIAFGFARVVGSLLFEVSPYDPGLSQARCACCWCRNGGGLLPARRAASVGRWKALRAE